MQPMSQILCVFLCVGIAAGACAPKPLPDQNVLNPDGSWTRPQDRAVMVHVPAGDFLMGSTEADPDAVGDEMPQHTVYVDAFWIDKTEVTNAQYHRCVEAGECDEPGCWDDEELNADDQPVVCVTWDGAQAYATWVGGRLPTEAEWEKAARGIDGRLYPWGNEPPDCSLANHAGCTGFPQPVGSYPDGAGPFSALDMAGNVWEWVADAYDAGYYARSPGSNPTGPDRGTFRVLRGGSFNINGWGVRCAVRLWDYPQDRYRNYGFRVASTGPAVP